jgi:outer membrane protein
MRRLLFIVLSIGLLSSLMLQGSLRQAAAQDAGNVAIGVVDMQRVLRESIAVTRLSEQLEAMRKGYRSELEEGEEVIREADVSLARERAGLDSEIYAQRRRKLELEATTLQREFQERMRGLDKVFRQSMAQIQQLLTLIAREIATERGLDLVLAKATVVLVKPELEFTEDALQRLNSQLPEVVLPNLNN